jgi:flagellar hook-associated protein 3 FlgL
MALLPIASPRVSEPLKNARLLFQLNSDQIAIQRKFDELSTGKRVSRISDDPAAAGRAIILQRGISRVEQLSRNAGVAESFYSATDESLKRLDDALIEARGATVEAAQNVLSDDERNAIALTIRSSLESALAAGNAIFRDQQLLGGTLQTSAALQYVGGEVLFNGTDAIAKTSVGGGGVVDVGINGNDALAVANRFYEGGSLQAGLDRSTPLRDLRGGEGVRPGLIRVSDSGNFVDVDLRSASTLGDIEDVLESLDLNGRSLQVTIQSNGITIDYADGLPGTLAIDDAAGDFLASDLSIRNPLGNNPPPLVATGLAPRVTETTLISKLNIGLGLNLSSGIRIQQGSQTFTVDLSQSNTVSDVLIAINRSGADVRAELDSSSGGIVLRSLRSGVDYSVGENGGTAATALGLRTATTGTLLSDLNRGRGITLDSGGPDLSIIRPDGVRLDIDLEGADTINDVINLISTHPQNQDTLRVVPSLNPVGNGIQLLGPPGVNEITVVAGRASNASEALGLVGKGQSERVGVRSGPFALFTGMDYHPREAGGTVDTLLRLEEAVRSGDILEIGRLQERLDVDLDRSTRMRGRVGVWSQNVEALKDSADNQAIALKSELSVEVDADLATVISELQQRQTSLEASLKLIGQSAQLTLLDFL